MLKYRHLTVPYSIMYAKYIRCIFCYKIRMMNFIAQIMYVQQIMYIVKTV